MKLQQWTREQKTHFAELSAQGLSVRAAMETLDSEYDNLHKYTNEQVRRYRISDECKEEISSILAKIRLEAENRSYAHQGSRIDAMVDVAEKLYSRIAMVHPEDVSKFVSLSGEFRQYMEAIRKEMAPYQATEDQALSLFERWVKLKDDAEKDGIWDATSSN